MMPQAMINFLAQNEVFEATCTTEMAEHLEDFAEYHSGGLYVLLRRDENNNVVKMHDSWNGEDQIVVHTYDPNAFEVDETESVVYFDNAVEAYDFFFGVPENPCSQCDDGEAGDYGMCDSCLHDAYRFGWTPGMGLQRS